MDERTEQYEKKDRKTKRKCTVAGLFIENHWAELKELLSVAILKLVNWKFSDGCESKKCDFYAECESDSAGEAHCVCPDDCEESVSMTESSNRKRTVGEKKIITHSWLETKQPEIGFAGRNPGSLIMQRIRIFFLSPIRNERMNDAPSSKRFIRQNPVALNFSRHVPLAK